MLHLKFALNLEHLADEMIKAISKKWNDPFNAPVVIFPDPKLEQWFRLRWMKRKGTLVNLNKSTIDRFLFDILVGKDDSKKKLTADILRNVILAYLVQKINGTPNYKTLDSEVTRYLMVDGNPEGELDENHLFDFASKMASLFLEYEASRPNNFAKGANGNVSGILDQWKQEKLQPFFTNFNKKLATREAWQQKLYSAIFHKHGGDSLLTQAFKNKCGSQTDEKKYLTIPFLYNNRNDGAFVEEKLPHGQDGKVLPVFIFGLSGMGQFYRVILHEYAKDHDVYAYIQNPCMEFWEDATTVPDKVCRSWNVSKTGEWKSNSGDMARIKDKMKVMETIDPDAENPTTDIDDIPETNASVEQENDLLVNWGRSGRDNIKLWCQATNYDFDFNGIYDEHGNETALPQDTLLHKVQYSIAHRNNEPSIAESDLSDGTLDVTAAPTKIREVENLHTQICKLLKKNEGLPDSQKVRVEDILVVSPCLDEYRTAINMVFDQNSAKPESDSEKEGYLHMPFAIVDSPAKNSLTENALSSLFAVLDQGSITRPDFFALVRNPVVQAARNISNDDVEAWQNWVAETNTFRARNEHDDWDTVKNRLLMAQMTSGDVEFDGETLRPFSDIACSDKASLCKFIDCIEALENWIEYGKNDCASLDELTEQIDNWIAMPRVPDSLKSESIVYRRVSDAISLLGWQNAAGNSSISMKIVKQSLLLAAQGTEYSCGNLFVNGITFMKFAPNRAIPVKHLFFIGADAASFPGARQHNTLDLRKSCRPWPGDDSPILKNRYAFLCQLMSTTEGFHLSYVNKDIKKYADFYPSSVINDLRKFIGTVWKEGEIPLDETRATTELFTPKELRNKIAYANMLSGNSKKRSVPQKQKKDEKQYLVKIPERVSFHALAEFLKDPFQFRIGLMLIGEDDEDVEKELFEPVFFDNLDTSIILKKALAAELSGEVDELEKFKQDLDLKGKSPNGEFGKKQWAAIDAKKELILAQMGGTLEAPGLIQDIQTNWSFGQKIQDLQLSRSNGTHWLLSGKLDWCNAKEIENVTSIIEVSSTTKNNEAISFDKYMAPYIKALAIIACKGAKNTAIDNESQSIAISIYSCDDAKSGPATTSVTMSPAEARTRLEAIYATAYGDEQKKAMPFSKAVPANLLGELKEKNIFSYADQLLDGPWSHFDKKSLFNPLTDVGFSPEKFASDWDSAEKMMRDLIAIKKFVPPETPKPDKPTTKKAATKKGKAKE